MDITKLFYIITNILYLHTIHISITGTMGKSKSATVSALSYFLFYCIDIIIYFYVKIPIIFTLSSILMYFLLTLPYPQKNTKKIIFTLILSLVSMLAELLSTSIVSLLSNFLPITPEYCLPYVMVIARLSFYLGCYILVSIYKKKSDNNYFILDISTILTYICSIFIIYISFNRISTIFEPYTAKANLALIIPSLLVIALNISTFYANKHKQHNNNLRQNNIMLNNAIKIQENQFILEKKLRDRFNKEKHDYKNFLISLQAELEQGKYDVVSASISEHIGLLSKKFSSDSGCYALDSIVNYKAEYAGEFGIQIKTKYRIEDRLTIKSEDLCILFGVALDNAIEYLSAHKELNQEISIFANYEKGEFTFAISNPVAENITIKNNSIPSTKKSERHGIGIESARHIISKYDGSLQLSCNNGEFIFGACIFI